MSLPPLKKEKTEQIENHQLFLNIVENQYCSTNYNWEIRRDG